MEVEGKARCKYQQQDYGAVELSQQQKDRIGLLAGLKQVSTILPEPF